MIIEKLNDENLDLSLKHILNKDLYKTIFYGQHIMNSKNEYIYDYHTTIEHKNSCYIIHIYRSGKGTRFYEEDKNKYHVTIKNQLNNAQYILIDENLYSKYLLLNSGHINADQEYLNQYELVRTIKKKS